MEVDLVIVLVFCVFDCIGIDVVVVILIECYGMFDDWSWYW